MNTRVMASDPTYVHQEDVEARLDMGHIRNAAKLAWEQMQEHRHALVGLTPGDMTLYKISLIEMHNGDWWVGGPLSGCSNQWTGPGHAEMHHYTKNHWRLDSWHTAAVMSLFLRELGKLMP